MALDSLEAVRGLDLAVNDEPPGLGKEREANINCRRPVPEKDIEENKHGPGRQNK